MRRAVLFLVFLFIVMNGGCSLGSEAFPQNLLRSQSFLEEYDVQPEYVMSENTFYNDHSVYYTCMNDWLYYYDTKTGSGGKVCGKAECNHDTASCNAYLGEGVSGVQVYDGKLYWLVLSFGGVNETIPEIYRSDPNGENRERYRVLEGNASIGNCRFYIHRGSVYVGFVAGAVEAGDVENELRITRYSMENPDDPGEEVLTQPGPYSTIGCWCRFYRDKLYIRVRNPLSLEERPTPYQDDLYVYDMVDKELRNIWSDQVSNSMRDATMTESGLEFLNYRTTGDHIFVNTEDQWPVWRSEYSFETGEMKSEEEHAMDPGYTVVYWVEGHYIAFRSTWIGEEEKASYRIYDESWTVLGEGELEGSPYIIGADEKGILLQTGVGMPKTGLYRIPWDNPSVMETLIQADTRAMSDGVLISRERV